MLTIHLIVHMCIIISSRYLVKLRDTLLEMVGTLL